MNSETASDVLTKLLDRTQERDALRAKLATAEATNLALTADVAAMREALGWSLIQCECLARQFSDGSWWQVVRQHSCELAGFGAMMDKAKAALSGQAGAALLEEVVGLRQAETEARLARDETCIE